MKDAFSMALGVLMILLARQPIERAYSKIKRESLQRVHKGLSPLTPFTQKLTGIRQFWKA